MKKILIIEDEAALQHAATQALKESGFDVLSAVDGDQGLRLAETELPDLILLDIILPKKDGFEVLSELKKVDKTKNIPVIVLTNLESPGDVQKALELGAKTYLVKLNYRLEEIVEKIKEVLG